MADFTGSFLSSCGLTIEETAVEDKTHRNS